MEHNSSGPPRRRSPGGFDQRRRACVLPVVVSAPRTRDEPDENAEGRTMVLPMS